MRAFAQGVDVITFEFENVSTEAAAAAAENRARAPDGVGAAHHAAARAREGVSRRPRLSDDAVSRRCATLDELAVALGQVGTPAILKTAAFGYDGKGQHRIDVDRGRRTRLGRHRPSGSRRRTRRRLLARVVGRRRARARRRSSRTSARSRTRTRTTSSTCRWRRRASPPDVASEAVNITRGDPRGARVRRRAVRRVLPDAATARCSSTRSRRGRTTPGTSPSTRASPASSSSRCAPCAACRWVRPTQMRPAAMVNLLGDLWVDGEPDWSGALRAARGQAASLRQDRAAAAAARWATSPRSPTRWTKRWRRRSPRASC